MATQSLAPTPEYTTHIQKPQELITEYVQNNRKSAGRSLHAAIEAMLKGDIKTAFAFVNWASESLDSAAELDKGRAFPFTAYTVVVGGDHILAHDVPDALPHMPGDILVIDCGVFPNSGDYVLVEDDHDSPNYICRYEKGLGGAQSQLIPVSPKRNYTLRVCGRFEKVIPGEAALIHGVLIASAKRGLIEPFVSFDLVQPCEDEYKQD